MLYLKVFGGVSGSCALLALAQAVSLSYGSPHQEVTYVAWYLLAGLLVLAAATCFLLGRRDGAAPQASQRREGRGGDKFGDAANLNVRGNPTAPILQNSPITNYHYGDVPSPHKPGDPVRRATNGPRESPEPPLHRAIASGISELESVQRMLKRAEDTRELPKKTPRRMQRTLGDLLTDQGWHHSRSVLDDAYGACEDFYDRLYVPARRFEGPMGDSVTPVIEASDNLSAVTTKVDRAIAELRSRQGSSAIEDGAASVTFDHVRVGKPRTFVEENEFHDSWRGMPVVFDLVNPQGGPKAKAVRPTVTVKSSDGKVLAGPANARWSTPESGRAEEVERDIAANGALVGIDTLVQPVSGDRFWLVTDEGLRTGLKSSTDPINEADVFVTLAIQGENFPKLSETVRVRLGFPLPAVGDADPADTLVPPTHAHASPASAALPTEPESQAPPHVAAEPDSDSAPAEDRDPVTAMPDDLKPSSSATAQSSGVEDKQPRRKAAKSFGLKGELQDELDEGYKLLSALRGGVVASWKYDRVPTTDDVRSWTANVEHLLRNNSKMLYLFRWKPLEHSAISNIRQALVSALGSTATIAELEQLLAQLEKVIEEL
jgi:hypothetical protein